MGRVRAFVYGAGCGLAGYLAMDVYVISHLNKIDAGLKALRHEVNPEAPKVAAAGRSEASAARSLLGAYRERAAEAFRKNWNSGLHRFYGNFVSSVRNPYLSGPSNPEPPASSQEQQQQ